MSHSHSTGSRLRRDVDTLLAGGKVVKSYPGTSQYSLKGVSACGLASVNVVKNVLSMEKGGCAGRALVEQMMYEEFMQVRRGLCKWEDGEDLGTDAKRVPNSTTQARNSDLPILVFSFALGSRGYPGYSDHLEGR